MKRINILSFILFLFAIPAYAQKVTDANILIRVRNLCYQNNYFIPTFTCIQKDGYFLVIPQSVDSGCIRYSPSPVIMDTSIKNIIYGWPCPASDHFDDVEKFHAIPWLSRIGDDFLDGDAVLDYEDETKMRDFDLFRFDANAAFAASYLPRVGNTDGYAQLGKDRFSIEVQDTDYSVSYYEFTRNMGFFISRDTATLYTLLHPKRIFGLVLLAGDMILYYKTNYHILSMSPTAAKKYHLTATGGIAATIIFDSTFSSFTCSSLIGNASYKTDSASYTARQIVVDMSSKMLNALIDNDRPFRVKGIDVPAKSTLWVANGKLISLLPAEDIQPAGFPQMKNNEWIFFKNNIPSSYVFTNNATICGTTFTQGGTVLNFIDPSGRILGYHLKSNTPFTIDNYEFAAGHWISLDSNQHVVSGFLNRDQIVAGVPLLSADHIDPTKDAYAIRAFRIRNNRVVCGNLSQNFDYVFATQTIPLASGKYFSLANNGNIKFGTIYKSYAFRGHVYQPGDKITGTYVIDTTVTILNKDELLAVVYYFRGVLQDATKQALLPHANKFPFGQFSDNDITQDTKTSYVTNGFVITNHVHARNLIGQLRPFSDCDADIYYRLSFNWAFNSTLNSYQFYLPAVWGGNTTWSMSFCPFSAALFAPIVEVDYEFFKPFVFFTPNINLFLLRDNISLSLTKLNSALPHIVSTISLTGLYIENDELKGRLQFDQSGY